MSRNFTTIPTCALNKSSANPTEAMSDIVVAKCGVGSAQSNKRG